MSSNHDQAARTLLKPQPAIMIIETPRLFPIQTSAEVLAWRIGKRTARIGTVRNWNTACVRYQILKPRKDSHESPIKSCTMSCKIKQRETWHCANSFPNSKAARWGKPEQDSPLRNTASSNLQYRLGLENSGKKLARCKERDLDNKTEQKIYVRARNRRRKGSNQYTRSRGAKPIHNSTK